MTEIQHIQQIDRERLVRANESQRQRIFELESETVELREQLKEAKQLIATQKSAIMAWQENDGK